MPKYTYFKKNALGDGNIKIDDLATTVSTGTAVAGAVTQNASAGVITSEALTTAAAAVYTLTITNSKIAAADIVLASVEFGTSTTGEPVIERTTPAAGSVVIRIKNVAAAAALNGTIKVRYFVVKSV